MSALYFRALKLLPDEYIDDNTHVAEHKDTVIVVNRNLPAIMFVDVEGRPGWKEITFEKKKDFMVKDIEVFNKEYSCRFVE